MPDNKKIVTDELDRIVSQARDARNRRETTYRERALKLFAHVCARCGRDFSGKKLRELTVHHKNHNHDDNPPDGSNWELLCIYCHDNEHQRHLEASNHPGISSRSDDSEAPSGFKPFENLAELLKSRTGKNS